MYYQKIEAAPADQVCNGGEVGDLLTKRTEQADGLGVEAIRFGEADISAAGEPVADRARTGSLGPEPPGKFFAHRAFCPQPDVPDLHRVVFLDGDLAHVPLLAGEPVHEVGRAVIVEAGRELFVFGLPEEIGHVFGWANPGKKRASFR